MGGWRELEWKEQVWRGDKEELLERIWGRRNGLNYGSSEWLYRNLTQYKLPKIHAYMKTILKKNQIMGY